MVADFDKLKEDVTYHLVGKELKRKGFRKQIAEILNVDFYDIDIIERGVGSRILKHEGYKFDLWITGFTRDSVNYITVEHVQ